MTSLSPETLEHLLWLTESGILPTVENQVKRHSAPYFWYDSSNLLTEQDRDCATICFVNTGQRIIGISANHVHEECVKLSRNGQVVCQIGGVTFDPALSRNGQVVCQIGGVTFDPCDRLIDRSSRLDLVTYDMSEIIVNQVGADIHHAFEWPPDLDPEGLLIIGGWVDELTRVHSRNSTYSFLHFIAYSDMIGEAQIGVVTYTSTSHPWGKESLPPDTNLGGISGGPVFLVREDPLTRLSLIGIIYEYGPTIEIIKACPLTVVREDGRIVDD